MANTFTLIPGGNILAVQDANGSVAEAITPWVLNASGIFVPWPVASDGTPQVELNGSIPAGTNTIGAIQITGTGGGAAQVTSNVGDATAATNPSLNTIGYRMQYNDSSNEWERLRGNTQGVLLASAARTAGVSSATQTNFNSASLVFFLDITAASGTGGLTPFLNYTDPVSGNEWQTVFTGGPFTAVGFHVFLVSSYAPSSSGYTSALQVAVPREWSAGVNATDSTSYTYSLGFALNVCN